MAGVDSYFSNNPVLDSLSIGDTGLGRRVPAQSSYSGMDNVVKHGTEAASKMINSSGEDYSQQLGITKNRAISPLLDILNAGQGALAAEGAMLGYDGPEAQQAALEGIELTPLEQEQMRREDQQLRSRRSVRGGVGGGNTIAQMLDLKGGQQGRTINDRLSRLSSVSQTGMSALSDILNMTERFDTMAAAEPLESAQAKANLRMGVAAPMAQSRMDRAEANALRDVSSSSARQNQMGQLSNIIGQVAKPATSAWNYYSGNTGVPTTVTPQIDSSGFTTGATISPTG
jgi:hypothetical protein